jgi:hypothetical protein
MEHALYEVFKHPTPFAGKKWAVQFPHGIDAYKTKRIATQVANSCKAIKATPDREEAASIEHRAKEHPEIAIRNLFGMREALIKPLLTAADYGLVEYRKSLMAMLISVDSDLKKLGVSNPESAINAIQYRRGN